MQSAKKKGVYLLMYSESLANIRIACMTDETFSRFSSFIYGELGIKMPFAKKTMLQARLAKRLRKLMLNSFEEYYEYVFSKEGIVNELPSMIDLVTTNKTDFFREPNHFDFLSQTALPGLITSSGTGIERKALVWSAGCSTGEEPYTLAMVLSEFGEKYPGYKFSVLATDISNEVINKARLGIYSESDVEPVPMNIRGKYLLRSRDRNSGRVRIIPKLRSTIDFRKLNFMEEDYRLAKKMDVVFCRNVIIYFDREIQEKVLNRLCRYLNPGGYLFMGHSETLNGMKLPLALVATTVYRKVNNE